MSASDRREGSHEHGSGSQWLNVDQARTYMGGVCRQTVYTAVERGLRVVRLTDATGQDTRGRRIGGRMLFYAPWIDEFLQARATSHRLAEAKVNAANSLNPQRGAASPDRPLATRLQPPAENGADHEPAGGR